MLSFALVLALLAAPADAPLGPVAVVITSKRPGADAYSLKVATRVFESLKREGVGAPLDEAAAAKELQSAGFSDPRSCDGSVACLVKLAVLLGPRAVIVGVDVGKVARSLAIHLEAVTSDGERTLVAVDLMAPSDKWQDQTVADFARFSRKVKDGLVPQRPATVTPEVPVKKPADAPVVAALQPPPPPPPAVDVVKDGEVSGGAPVLPWVAAGGAVVAVGLAGTLGALGLSDKNAWTSALVTLPDGTQGSRLSQADATALAGSANAKLTGALVSGVVGVALGVTAGVLFASPTK